MKAFLLIAGFIIYFSQVVMAQADPTAKALREDLEFNSQRRKAYKQDQQSRKIFNQEREKGLSLFLEEQEKFDLERDRGLAEYKKEKSLARRMEEGGPEDRADQLEKKKQQDIMNKLRVEHIKSRDTVLKEFAHLTTESEEDELGIKEQRPRYDLRKRSKNKWVKSGTSLNGGSGASASMPAPIPNFNDFNNPPDFVPGADSIPQAPPFESFDESMASPQAMPFDATMGNSSPGGFSDLPPPPPPTDDGWDF